MASPTVELTIETASLKPPEPPEPLAPDAHPPSGDDHRAPVLLIATANEAEGARHLRSLADELRDIVAALEQAQRARICDVVTLPDATPEQVVRVFQSDEYRDRVAVLHFAGHAGPEGLLFETSAGDTAVADAAGLAAFLGVQRGLQLVVLNACATQSHVDALRDAGVGAVIATSRTVEDAIAHQFAVLLYQGLGSGAGIKRAYDEAAAGVRFKHGAVARGSTAESMHASAATASPPDAKAASVVLDLPPATRDIARRKSVKTEDGRWPWDLYFRRGAEETVAPWALPEAAGNPLFGLPPLPETDKPLDAPFRHLRPFAREHAELFFGRGKDIRELYDKVTSTASEPVVLLYGATGVGKSSLLDAGLLPRLTGMYEVRYAPRDRALGLLGTLARALGVDATGTIEATSVADAWRRTESECGRPLFIVVDQLEEAYTSEDAGHAATGAAARELDAFAAAIASLFANDVSRPRGRLVLGFRKEWLSEVKAALETHRVPRTEHRLEQLTRGGLLEAINGPTRLPVRRMPTQLTLEPGLDVVIADDLLANRASHVAPLLQILLAEMWADAPRRDGVARFEVGLYDTVRAKAQQLDAFLTQQLEALRVWHAPAVESGLALDYLRFHTTPKGSSDERTVEEERLAYPSANDPPPGLRAMCARLFLLVERLAEDAGGSAGARTARLAHDTLAPLVRERFERSDAPGPRARRILEGRAAEWSDGRTGVPLDEQDLGVVEVGEQGMRAWTDDEKRLVAASRMARERARRRRAWVIRGAIAAVTLIAGFGVGSWILYRQSQTRLAESSSREFGARALTTDARRRDVALLYAVTSYERAPTFEARRSLLTQLARDPSLIRVASTSGNDLAFAEDGGRIFLAALDGIHVLDIATGVESLIGNLPKNIDPVRLVFDRQGTVYSAMVASDSNAQLASLGVWDLVSGRPMGVLELPAPNGAEQVAWTVGPRTPDGSRVVAVTEQRDMMLWDVTSGTPRHRLRGHTQPPALSYFSSDGSVLVTSADDGRVIAWDVATGKALRTAPISRSRLALVAISRDNSTMAVTADDTVSLWSLRTTRPPRRMTGVDFGHVAFTEKDSALVVSARNGEILVFGEPLNEESPLLPASPSLTLHGAGDTPDAIAVSAVGGRIAVMSQGLVQVWDLADSTLMRRSTIPSEPTGEITSLTPDAKFAVAQTFTELALWDVATSRLHGRVTHARSDSTTESYAVAAIGASGRFLVAPAREAADRGPRDIFDARTGVLVRSLAIPVSSTLAVDPVGSRVAWGLAGRRAVVLMDLASPEVLDTLDAGSEGLTDADSLWGSISVFSPRGDLLVTQASQRSILVWDLATRRVRDTLSGMTLYASKLLVSQDGGTVAAVEDLDNTATFWRRGSPTPLGTLRATVPRVVALSPDGRLLAFESSGIVTLADVARGEILGEIDTRAGPAAAIAFVDGGRAVLAVTGAGRVTRIVTDPTEWAKRACAIAGSPQSFQRFTADAPGGAQPPQRCR